MAWGTHMQRGLKLCAHVLLLGGNPLKLAIERLNLPLQLADPLVSEALRLKLALHRCALIIEEVHLPGRTRGVVLVHALSDADGLSTDRNGVLGVGQGEMAHVAGETVQVASRDGLCPRKRCWRLPGR